ncbi:MAG TPA: DNA-3-methyladenine glycosylase [Rhizomicrobium sp.]|nr:DNA-3-methyladenine glycosylase [Rhizomicrobium sp.]
MPKPQRITTPRHLDAAITGLLAADARFHAVLARTGKPPHRHRRSEGFEALISIVVSQQLSTAAADTIFARLKQQITPFDPAAVLGADEAALRACGLSAPKQKHIKAIASAILEGTLDLAAIRTLGDDDARAHLTAIKGIGPWTADIYLMSSLARADIWPVGDVALQAAIARALKLRKRPDPKAMEKLSKRWRPWRTVAARLFWMHEDGLRRERREALQKTKSKKGKA